jgi:predicted nucleic acid-binding protein
VKFMVDTQTLIYSTTKVGPKTEPHHVAMIRSAKALLASIERISVSAIVAAEYVPLAGNPSLWSRFEIVPFDAGQSFRAAELCKELREMPALCPLCLNPKRTPKACSACKHHADRRGREQDLRVAAAADCSGVQALYTFDGWLISDVAPLMRSCVIRRPPNPDGPLFENRDDSAGNVVDIGTAKK